MAKEKKKEDKKEEEKPVQKKDKKDITISTDLSFEELLKMAVNTSLPKKKK
jgi:hypothetical protein